VDFEFRGKPFYGFVKRSEKERVLGIIKRAEAEAKNPPLGLITYLNSTMSQTRFNKMPLDLFVEDLLIYFAELHINLEK